MTGGCSCAGIRPSFYFRAHARFFPCAQRINTVPNLSRSVRAALRSSVRAPAIAECPAGPSALRPSPPRSTGRKTRCLHEGRQEILLLLQSSISL
jgi:hypothetical protein